MPNGIINIHGDVWFYLESIIQLCLSIEDGSLFQARNA